jgi:hypothetical protein
MGEGLVPSPANRRGIIMANFLIIASHDEDIIGTPPIIHYGDKKSVAAYLPYLEEHGYYVEVCKVTAPLTSQALQSLRNAE